MIEDGRVKYWKKLKDDPVFFVKELYNELNLDDERPISDIESDMIRFAATGIDENGQFHPWIVILAPRTVGKTYLCVCAVICWLLFCNPKLKLQMISESKSHTDGSMRMVREWFRSVWFLNHLEPTDKKRQRDTVSAFDVVEAGRNPSVVGKGVDSMITGGHSDIVFADDIVTRNNVRTVASRREVRLAFNEFPNIASYGEKRIVVVGTHWHEESVYVDLESVGYYVRTYPAVAPMQGDEFINLAPIVRKKLESGEIKHTEDGQYPLNPLFKHVLPTETLYRHQRLGTRHFDFQYLLRKPGSRKSVRSLKLRDVMIPSWKVHRDYAPAVVQWGPSKITEWQSEIDDPNSGLACCGRNDDRLFQPAHASLENRVPYSKTIMFIDPAVGGRDQQAWCVIGEAAGNLFCKCLAANAAGADNWGQEAVDNMVRDARTHGASEIHLEHAGQQIGLAPLVEAAVERLTVKPGSDDPQYPNGWTAYVKCGKETAPTRHGVLKGHKHVRIVTVLQAVLENHRLIMDKEAIRPNFDEDEEYHFQRQLAFIEPPQSNLRSIPHDDRIEVLAMACFPFVDELRIGQDRMRVHAEKQSAREKMRSLADQLAKIGRRKKSHSVIQHL